MKRNFIKTRTILVLTALAAVVVDGAWLAVRSRPETAEFLLQPTQTTFVDNTVNPAGFPVFDPVTRTWLFQSKILISLKPFVRHPDPKNLGPDDVGDFVVIRFPERMAASSLRPALLSLADQGICKLAALGFDQSTSGGMFPEGVVYVIERVQDDHGRTHLCRETKNS